MMKSMYRTGLIMISAALLALGTVNAQADGSKAGNGYTRQKVVYHVNDLEHAKAALRNIKNHLNAVGDNNIDLIVVTHSGGAFMLVDGSKDKKGNTFTDDIAALANRGVKFDICANTIRGKKIDKNKINQYAKVVPSGVAEIAKLEQEGYVYVKP